MRNIFHLLDDFARTFKCGLGEDLSSVFPNQDKVVMEQEHWMVLLSNYIDIPADFDDTTK